MKPHVICHMLASVDGRILPSRWRPRLDTDLYERLHGELAGDAWLVGRTTGQEFAKGGAPYPETAETFPRETWLSRPHEGAWGVVLDAQGRIAWGRADIGGDPILVVLTTSVPDRHLAGLRAEGVSYCFAGEREIDLAGLLETLGRELGVRRLLMEGGGVANGALLRAGLVDELSLVVCPTVDGAAGAPAVFDGEGDRAPVGAMRLTDCQRIEGDYVWLRYSLERTVG